MALEEFLGEALAGFESRGGAGGADGAEAAAGEFVDDTEHEREFGTDDGEVGLELVGEGEHGVEAFEIDGEAVGFFGDAGVAGGANNLRGAGRLAKLPDESVLAASGAKDEDFQGTGHLWTFKGRGGRTRCQTGEVELQIVEFRLQK
jgi:hypothetical protein